jgi:hypothetical protein
MRRSGGGHRRLPRVVCPRRLSAAVQLLALRRLLERQHAELMGEVRSAKEEAALVRLADAVK